MSKRVLHILGSLAIGGAENLVLDLLRYSATAEVPQVEFDVVYMHPSPPERVELFQQALGDRGELKYIGCGKGLKASFKFVRELHRYLRVRKIDEIHCHNNVDAYWAYLATVPPGGCPGESMGKKRVILTVHGMNLNFEFLSAKFLGYTFLERRILKNLEIKYVSVVTAEFYRDRYNWRELDGEIVYNGINWDKFPQRGECGVGERLSFAMVGNFNTPVRLQKMLCEALVSISPLPFNFYFIGTRNSDFPSLYDSCVEICREGGLLDKSVFFLGKRDDVPQLLQKMDGYVYASSADTFGISVVEAAGCGLPVLCSDIPTFREVLQQGKFGKLIPNTPDEFAQQMLLLARRLKVTHLEVGDTAVAQLVRETYSVKRCFEKYYE